MEHQYPIGMFRPFLQEQIKFLLAAVVNCRILLGVKLCVIHLICIRLQEKLICIVSFGTYCFFILKKNESPIISEENIADNSIRLLVVQENIQKSMSTYMNPWSWESMCSVCSYLDKYLSCYIIFILLVSTPLTAVTLLCLQIIVCN